MSCEHAREFLEALSLDALDVDERDHVEDHVAGCSVCAADLRDLVDTTAHLALAVPQREPSLALKHRVLSVASRPSPHRPASQPWWTRLNFGLLRPHPAMSVAAVALVVALGASFWAASLQSQLTEQRALATSLRERAGRYDRVVAVLQSQNIQLRGMEGTQLAPSASGRVYVDPESGSGMMMVRSLPPLPQGRSYQLWWARTDGTRESGGVLSWTDPQGNSYGFVQCPGQFKSWQSFGLTEEPAGGSPSPTGQRLLAGQI